jgi:hypothetical protein
MKLVFFFSNLYTTRRKGGGEGIYKTIRSASDLINLPGEGRGERENIKFIFFFSEIATAGGYRFLKSDLNRGPKVRGLNLTPSPPHPEFKFFF